MIYIVDYGINNITSITKMLDILDKKYKVIDKPTKIDSCKTMILPGIGHFSKAMTYLKTTGLDELIYEHVKIQKRPVFGICLGMQLMSSFSEEGDVEGLKLIDAKVSKITSKDLRIPHTGWNYAYDENQRKKYYFMHSYYFKDMDKKYIWLKTNIYRRVY